ncbi:ATP-binding protein [Streptomyces sp. HNM0575]|uniref:ATP-binding protein n=1 Tax=Streptomyces sp. HNM0575 TaxID=2716338 RepID=UPI00145F2054|nr:ATP-binding protein [Streptomyces sp. HNM0575]NLU72099.1 ATP-binding protein [Streptomyces sp. HNM0575]
MSLPLTRRIAKTVLLTAAGAASVVGAAGAASAAELPTTADVGGLSNLDNGVESHVSGAAEGAQALTPKSSTSPLQKTDSLPEAGASADTNNGRTVEEASKLAGSTATGTNEGLQKQTPNVQKQLPDVRTQGLPADALGQANAGKALPAQAATAKQAPTQKLSTDNLPTKTLLPNGLGVVSFH